MINRKWPDGVIVLYGEELSQYEVMNEEWESMHQKGGVISSQELLELPERVDWHWGHNECLSEGMYDIPYSRFDTVEKVLNWTLHMMEKSWLPHTRWVHMVKSHYNLPDA